MAKPARTVIAAAGREVTITNPDKVYFPRVGLTKLDLVRYAAVSEAALRGIAGRPIVLHRHVNGAEGQPFYQKRAPESRPEWVEVGSYAFHRGAQRTRSWCATRRSCCGS